MNYVVTNKQSLFLLLTSHITLLTSSYGYITSNNTSLKIKSIIHSGIYFTSVNYWHNPRYNTWQRKLDIIYTNIAILYSIIYAQYTKCFALYNQMMLITGIIYIMNLYIYHNTKYKWISVVLHGCVHLISNYASYRLYIC